MESAFCDGWKDSILLGTEQSVGAAAVTWSLPKVSSCFLQPALCLSVPSLGITVASRAPLPSSLPGPCLPPSWFPDPALAHILQRRSLFVLELFLLSSQRPLCPLLSCVLSLPGSKAISALKKKSLRKEWTFNLEWRVKKKKCAEVPSGRQVTHSNGKPNFNQLLSHYHTQTLWISWTIYLRLVPLKLGSYSFKRSFHFTLPR